MTADITHATAIRRSPAISGLLAAALGNALEWFDLISYGFLAPVIGRLFFPSADPHSSLLIALGSFGVAYLSRPLGGIVLGLYADRAGRKAALLAGMLLMMGGTLLLTLTPTYRDVGLAGPILIVCARLLQGFAAGGEFGSATAFLVEQSPDRRAFFASWQMASQGLSIALGAGVAAILSAMLPPDALNDWGWRIPFALGLLIGPVAFYIRARVEETPDFQRASLTDESQFSSFPQLSRRQLLVALGVVALATVAAYMLIYAPSYAAAQLKLPMRSGGWAVMASGGVVFLLTPLFGLAADKYGTVRVGMIAAAALVVLPIPLFMWLVDAPSAFRLTLIDMLIAIPTAGYYGPLGALMSSLFPTRGRSTGLSASYNLAVIVFGAFAPLTMEWLINRTHWLAVPGIYLAIAALISFGVLAGMRAIPIEQEE